MPIYEYRCANCQEVFEEWLKAPEMTDVRPCPKCGGEARHILSHTSFVLKGGGWYVDDYGYRKGIKDDSTAGAGGGEVAPSTCGSAAPDKSRAVPTAAAAKKSGEPAPKPAPRPVPNAGTGAAAASATAG